MSITSTSPTEFEMPRQSYEAQSGFFTEETHWGYIVRSTGNAGHRLMFSQSISLLTGAALLAATIGMWLVPGIMGGIDAMIMRLSTTIIFASSAVLLLWYASRGVMSEIQIDNGRGEIREVVRNHAGKVSLLASYSFDSIGGVFMEPTGTDDAASLVLRYRNSSDAVEVASGRETDLSALRDRISRDVIVGNKPQKDDMSGMGLAA